ncbi:MAG: hypothetical protein U1D35_06385 [Paracoccaceae bacterium]|nr:hypothetical protein [Paracoccaceae bacterium]
MAQIFPLPIDVFFSTLLISEVHFDAPAQVVTSQTGGGEQLTADIGPALWSGEVILGRMTASEAANATAMIDLLGPAGRSFHAYDPRRPFPASDPGGIILGAATPSIFSIPAGGREMRIQGLPSGYVLGRGDYLAFDYGAGRRALHRVVSASVVAAGGTTPVFEVHPMLRAGASVGAAVTLIRPACKAVLVAGSVNAGTSRRTITDGMSFRFQQTLGAA